MSKDKERHDFITSMTLRCGNSLRKKLATDENHYQRVSWISHSDARSFFIYGCLDEIMKAATASLRWIEFLKETDEKLMESEGDNAAYIQRAVHEAVYDEQQMWSRKLHEIQADLILFSITNEQEYFRLYLAYRELEKYLGFQNDLNEFFGCQSGNALHSINSARSIIGQMEAKTEPAKRWFLKTPVLPENPRPGGLFTSTRQKILRAIEGGTPDQRIALGISYDRGYSLASKSVHSNIGDPQRQISAKNISTQLGRIGLMSAHIILSGYELLGIEPEGSSATLKKTFLESSAGHQLHSSMCKDFKVGDIVVAYGDDLCLVTEVSKSKYGYTSCKVRFLEQPMLPELLEDWFSAPYVQIVVPKANLLEDIKAIFANAGQEFQDVPDEHFLVVATDAAKKMIESGEIQSLKEHVRKAAAKRAAQSENEN